MSRDEIFAKIKETIVEQLGAEESDISLEANFRDDLEADSVITSYSIHYTKLYDRRDQSGQGFDQAAERQFSADRQR